MCVPRTFCIRLTWPGCGRYRANLDSKPSRLLGVAVLVLANLVVYAGPLNAAMFGCQAVGESNVGGEVHRFRYALAEGATGNEVGIQSNPFIEGGCIEDHDDHRDRCLIVPFYTCPGWFWQREYGFRQDQIYYRCPSTGGYVWRVFCIDPWYPTGDCCRTNTTVLPPCAGNGNEPSCSVPWPPG